MPILSSRRKSEVCRRSFVDKWMNITIALDLQSEKSEKGLKRRAWQPFRERIKHKQNAKATNPPLSSSSPSGKESVLHLSLTVIFPRRLSFFFSLNKRKTKEDRPKEKSKRNYFAFYFSQPQLVCLFFPFSLFFPHSFSIILFHGSFFLVFCSLSFLEIVKWNPISSLWV